MTTWTNRTVAATLAILLTLTACSDTAPDEQPQHPQAETAQQVVDALVSAYAAWRSDVEERPVEVQPVGLALKTLRFIPDRGLAEAMATLPLPHSEPDEWMSPAAWTIGFMSMRYTANPEPGKLLVDIVDSADPGYGLTFAVVVGPDGTVGDAYHTGWTNREG